MQNPLLWGAVAMVIGLAGAGVALYALKPLDRPLTTPGSTAPQEPVTAATPDLTAPPLMILLGAPEHRHVFHLVLGDDREANKQVYDMAMQALQSTPDMTLNIIPAMSAQTPLYKAFTWAVALGNDKAQQGFVDGVMGTTGAITTPVLSVIAQNNGIDVAKLKTRIDSPEVKQAIEQAQDVLPPALPALYINGSWLAGDLLSPVAVTEALGQAQNDLTLSGNALLVAADAYAFATPPKPEVAAIFMNLRNLGKTPITLTGASSPVAGRIEIHGHTQDANGVMQMRAQPTLEIKPGETVVMKPAGLHLMLYDLPAPLVVGQRIPLTLQLQGGSEISTLAVVTKPGEVLTDAPQSE